MGRTLILILCVFSIGTLSSQAIGVAFLWSRGRLTAQTLQDIRQVLSGVPVEEIDPAEDEKKAQLSREEVMRQRIQRILELGAREQELGVLKKMISDDGRRLIEDQIAFERQKRSFQQQLEDLNTRTAAAATEQARGILLAMPPADAVANLMPLELEENILLLQGMPEQSIAKILQEFYRGGDKHRERGEEIFKAIALGEPTKSLIDRLAGNLDGADRTDN